MRAQARKCDKEIIIWQLSVVSSGALPLLWLHIVNKIDRVKELSKPAKIVRRENEKYKFI